MNWHERLKRHLSHQTRRMRRAERERPTLLAQSIYLSTLGLVLVLPVVAGAYLGLWLDEMGKGYSVRWTLGCILLGLIVGVVNVYYLVRQSDGS